MLAVDGLGQDLGAAGLAGAAGAGEQIGMAELAGLKLGLERLRHADLPHHLVKGPGTVFPIQRLVHVLHLLAGLKNLRPVTRSHTYI